jgi:hypothetical protein
MTTMTMHTETRPALAVVPRDPGLVGRLLVTWTVAGGLLVGGFLVAAMTLMGRLSGNALLMTASVLYVGGAALGFTHGAVLAVLGRPAGMSVRQALSRVGVGALYAVPAATVGFLAAGWVAMTVMALYLGRVLPLLGVAAGWIIGAVIVLLALVIGSRALANAWARWGDRRVGSMLVAACFSALLVILLAERPEIWGLRLRVTTTGAVLLALAATAWVAGPLVTLALALRRRLAAPVAVRGGLAASLAVALLVGGVLGLLALPFHKAAFTGGAHVAGPAGLLVLVAARALVDEVLLRLAVVSAAAYALLHYVHVPARAAALLAVLLATAAQALLYLPGIGAVGFATLGGASGYLLVTAVLPALAFGTLYWTRGLPAAVVAHATALLTVAVIL